MTDSFVPLVRPPREWERGTLALAAAIVAAGLCEAVQMATALALRQLSLDQGWIAPAVLRWTTGHPVLLDYLSLASMVAYMAGFLAWRTRAVDLLRGRVPDLRKTGWHWTIPVWIISLLAGFPLHETGPDGLVTLHDMSSHEIDALVGGVRLAGLVILGHGIRSLHRRVREALARSGGITWSPAFHAPDN